MENQPLRIAIQKSGKLSSASLELLNKCNFNIQASKNHYLVQTKEANFLLIRDDDIPEFIASEVSDLGIVGQNIFYEYTLQNPQHNLTILAKLNFAFCRLSIAVNHDSNFKSLKDLNGKIIATSYPETLRNFLKQHNLQAKILLMHGSVELAAKIAIADAICDLVSTGATLKENGLVELTTVLTSEAVLIGRNNAMTNTQNQIQKLLFRMQSVINAQDSKYIMLHINQENLAQLKEILPGSEAPTVLPLHNSDNKVAVHVVSKEGVFWDTMTKLKAIGASSILVLPIEKMVE